MTQLEFSFDRQLQEGDHIVGFNGKVYEVRKFNGVLCATRHFGERIDFVYVPVSIVLALWSNFKICYKT